MKLSMALHQQGNLMGTTHVVARRAAVYTDPGSDERFYALFEKTYESNVHPKTPAWNFQWFGDAASCMHQILSWSKACEAGMIQSSRRLWSADEYIAKWRSELAAPVAGSATALAGKFKIDGYGPGIVNYRNRDALLKPIADFGEHMDGERFRIELNRPGALRAIASAAAEGWGVLGGLFSIDDTFTLPRRDLGVARPGAVKPDLSRVEVLYAEDPESPSFERNYVVMIDGHGTPGGWRYSAVGAFIDLFVRSQETAQPGSAEPLLKAFAAKVAMAGAVPDDVVIRLDPSLDPERCEYKQAATARMVERLGADPSAPLVTTAGHARSLGLLSLLAGQGLACRFEWPASNPAPQPGCDRAPILRIA